MAFQSVSLKVCEGCGTLWVRRRADAGVYCGPCALRLQDFPDPKTRRRPGRPVKRRAEHRGGSAAGLGAATDSLESRNGAMPGADRADGAWDEAEAGDGTPSGAAAANRAWDEAQAGHGATPGAAEAVGAQDEAAEGAYGLQAAPAGVDGILGDDLSARLGGVACGGVA